MQAARKDYVRGREMDGMVLGERKEVVVEQEKEKYIEE